MSVSTYDYRGFSSYEEHDEDPVPRQPRCSRCGSTDVRWRHQGGKWVMFSLQPGVEHQCPARTATADEFD
jgi:hypothetical protein